jgi:5'-AMP-activated protein kinase regulatory beta subunit
MDGEGRVNNIIEAKAPIKPTEPSSYLSDEEHEDLGLYGQSIPSLDDFSAEPPVLPPQLGVVLLNNIPNNDQAKRSSAERPSSLSSTELDSSVLPIPQHVTVNHLYVSAPKIDSIDKEEVSVVGLTHRYKSKFVTTVLYKPRQPSSHPVTLNAVDLNNHAIESKA